MQLRYALALLKPGVPSRLVTTSRSIKRRSIALDLLRNLQYPLGNTTVHTSTIYVLSFRQQSYFLA